MNGNRFIFFVVFLVITAIQSAQTKAANRFCHSVKYLSDTSLPINVMSDDKMNIMIDYQKELIAIQCKGLNKEDRKVILADSKGKLMEEKELYAGSTLVFFETQALYEGEYVLKIQNQSDWIIKPFKLIKPE